MSKSCNNCGTEQKNIFSVPYVVYESDIARMERTIKRLWVALIIAICAMFLSFGMFVAYESQFETITYDYVQDGSGTNIIGEGINVNNGSTFTG